MRKLIILAALALAACKADPTSPPPSHDAYPELPRSSSMETEGEIKAPQAAREFCERHPEFEQC